MKKTLKILTFGIFHPKMMKDNEKFSKLIFDHLKCYFFDSIKLDYSLKIQKKVFLSINLVLMSLKMVNRLLKLQKKIIILTFNLLYSIETV